MYQIKILWVIIRTEGLGFRPSGIKYLYNSKLSVDQFEVESACCGLVFTNQSGNNKSTLITPQIASAKKNPCQPNSCVMDMH